MCNKGISPSWSTLNLQIKNCTDKTAFNYWSSSLSEIYCYPTGALRRGRPEEPANLSSLHLQRTGQTIPTFLYSLHDNWHIIFVHLCGLVSLLEGWLYLVLLTFSCIHIWGLNQGRKGKASPSLCHSGLKGFQSSEAWAPKRPVLR